MSAADHIPDAGKMMPTELDYTRDLAADLAIQQAATKGTWINLCEPLGHVVAVDGDDDSYARHICREPEGDERTEDMDAIANAGTHAQGWIRRANAAEAAILDVLESIESENILAYISAIGAAEAIAARIRAGREKGAQP